MKSSTTKKKAAPKAAEGTYKVNLTIGETLYTGTGESLFDILTSFAPLKITAKGIFRASKNGGKERELVLTVPVLKKVFSGNLNYQKIFAHRMQWLLG